MVKSFDNENRKRFSFKTVIFTDFRHMIVSVVQFYQWKGIMFVLYVTTRAKLFQKVRLVKAAAILKSLFSSLKGKTHLIQVITFCQLKLFVTEYLT